MGSGFSAGDVFSEVLTTDGTTTVIRGTATTTWTAYPTTATTNIQSVVVENDRDVSGGIRIWVALDNAGTNYTSLGPGDSLEITPKSKQQIFLRTNSSTATFSMWVNREL
jgi:hypothetical protein